MSVSPNAKRVFVTGGTGFLGYRVVRALLEQGADVTVMVRPGSEEKLGTLRGKVQWVEGDPWHPASMRGRARGHAIVIHLIGGLKPDPARGLTFRHLNYVSVRNVAQMAVGDGVPHILLLSVSAAPLGVKRGYVESKRDAEQYIQNTGLSWTIVRAPTLYVPGQPRGTIYRLLSILGAIPLFGLALSAYTPLSVDTAARGITSLALSSDSLHNRLIKPHQLRRIGRNQERRFVATIDSHLSNEAPDDSLDEPPFGWLPPGKA
ncbi:MAG: NAD(P)H-binding protein [Chloroflexota bacterium]